MQAGGCEDGQGSLSVAPASSLSLRFRSRGRSDHHGSKPAVNSNEHEARQSEAASALLRAKVATVVWGVRDSSVVAPPVTCLALTVRVCLLWDELLGVVHIVGAYTCVAVMSAKMSVAGWRLWCCINARLALPTQV